MAVSGGCVCCVDRTAGVRNRAGTADRASCGTAESGGAIPETIPGQKGTAAQKTEPSKAPGSGAEPAG